MAGNFQEFQNPRKRVYLNTYAQTARHDLAAKVADVHPSLHWHWLKDDPDYPAAYKLAQDMAADALENEAARRAVEGVDKPVFWKGRQISKVKEYDTTLLIFLLKGLRPEKYKERLQVDVSGYLRQLAEDNGLDPDEVLREAQSIVSGGHSR